MEESGESSEHKGVVTTFLRFTFSEREPQNLVPRKIEVAPNADNKNNGNVHKRRLDRSPNQAFRPKRKFPKTENRRLFPKKSQQFVLSVLFLSFVSLPLWESFKNDDAPSDSSVLFCCLSVGNVLSFSPPIDFFFVLW